MKVRTAWVVTALLATQLVAAAETQWIEPAALASRLQRHDESLLVVDVRSRQEYAAGHIPGALNIPYDELPARAVDLPYSADRQVVLYCVSGVRVTQAMERLREHGYTQLFHLRGDFAQWSASGLPQTSTP